MKRLYLTLSFFIFISISCLNSYATLSISNTEESDKKAINRITPVSSIKLGRAFGKISIPNREIKSVSKSAIAFERNFDDEEFFSNLESSIEMDPLDWGKYRPSEVHNMDSIKFFAGEAISLLQSVKDEGRLIDQLTAAMTFELPVGVQREIGELLYTVVFHKLKLTETNAYVDAYLVIETSSDSLIFMGRGIEFSAEGGITGEGRLELIGNTNITLPGDKALITLLGSDDPTELSPTYAEFDCYGFKELAIDADVTFSKDLFIKENPDGSRSEDRLTSNFTTTITDWNNILVDLTLPRFQLKSLEGWSFEVSNAVFDFSDTRNSTDITFPEGYDSPYFIEGTRELWRGFYLRELVVTLPEEFNKKNTTGRTSFRAEKMIIDETGFSGSLSVREIISLDEGNADSWKLSVDSLYANFLQNELISAGLTGEIEIPSMESDQPLLYTGTILGPGNYQLIAELQDQAKFDIFKADLNLASDSYIQLKVEGGKFKPKAVLNGNMSLAPTSKSGKKTAEVNGLVFQQLVLQTEEPYIDAETLRFQPNSDNKTGGFPIDINAIELKTEDNRVGIFADITVKLVKADDSGFGAGTDFTVWAKRENLEGRQIYRYDEIELSKITVAVERPGFSINGSLIFYEGDNTYGDGFRGEVQAKFANIGVSAVALFGRVNGLRYWYVDALVEWEDGLPVVSPFVLNGIGGGAFYHMRQQGLNENIGSEIGKSTSGIIYVPDPDYHLGIKASVTFSIYKAQTTANGNAEFSVAFNSSGGVNQVSFNGGVEIMTQEFSSSLSKVQEIASKVSNQEEIERNSSASISGKVNLLFDNINDTFHGEISMYINAAGGLVKGINSGGLAGKAIIHFAPTKWYIHIGNPTVPIGIEIFDLAQLQGYFMVGHDIPPMPPPPDLVLEILTAEQRVENEQIRASSRMPGDQESGKGFAFGARFNIETGNQKFLMFYGRFAATTGFDINMQNLNRSCAGRDGLIGINGWYAEGQAYFGMLATIGMKVNLKFIKKDVEIFHGELAALMQVKGPNPFWMRGDAAGSFSVLNGLVTGSFDFTVTIGEMCEMQYPDGENPLSNVSVIAQLTPDNNDEEVDVFTSPQAVFNIPVDKEFRLEDLNGEELRYRADLEYFRLRDNNGEVDARLSYNSSNKVIALNPTNILASEKNYTLEISLSFKEYVDNAWQTVKENGVDMKENLSYSFKSGLQPDYIPKEMVAYTYPIEGMINFYQDEYDKGYIKLNQGGLTRPFETEKKWNLMASFTNQQGQAYRSSFSFNSEDNEVSFRIPEMGTGEIYHFELLRVPKSANAAIDENVSSKVNRVQGVENGERDINFEITTQEATGTLENLEEEEIYSYYMRASEFKTLEEKFNSPDYYNYVSNKRYYIRPGVHYLSLKMLEGHEIFSENEIYGSTSGSAPLIEFYFESNNNVWFQNYIEPLVYSHSQFNSSIKNENKIYGLPPFLAYTFLRNTEDFRIDQSAEFNQEIYSDINEGIIYFYIADYVDRQYADIRNAAATYYVDRERPSSISNLLGSNFPMLRKGSYATKIKYTLPGGRRGKSNFEFNIINPVGPTE